MATRHIENVHGPAVAMLQAAVIAAELAEAGENYRGCVVWVIDEQGKEIGKVPVATSLE